MMPFPAALIQYVYHRSFEERHPAYLKVDPQGILLAWGGRTAFYGLGTLEANKPVTGQVYFLESLLPVGERPLMLPCVELENGLSADIHIFVTEDVHWVLLLDATRQLVKKSQFQQKNNELTLDREKRDRLLEQYIGKHVLKDIDQGALRIQQGGERREVTILFADIRGFTTFSEANTPMKVFQSLNNYLRAMIRPVQQEAGLVDKIIGDAVMAIFGLRPTTRRPQEHALVAAEQMILAVRDLNQFHELDNLSKLEIGIGIATGTVAIGILGSMERRSFSVIGHHVNLAARLEGMARRNEIVVDGNTYKNIGSLQHLFTETEAPIKGLNEQVPVFSWQVRAAD